jgi:DNA glycosylase AlkZ-like
MRTASPREAVSWMLAMQGQDLPGVKWSVAVRTPGARETDIEAAFDAGEIVRSWPMRGTLHVVQAVDLRWMLALTAERSLASAARRRAALGITESEVERARAVAEDALPGRRALGRAAMLAAIAEGGVPVGGQRGYHLLWYLAQTGTLVLGPSDGRQQAFARLDAWVPNPRRLERDEALGELARRYFLSHGPATVHDLARWSGLTVREVLRGLEVCGGELATLEVDGTTYHLAPELADAAPRPSALLLLPGFDEYILGYGDRSVALAREHRDAVVPGGNGVFKPTIVVDGAVVGTWARRLAAGQVRISAAWFASPPGKVLDGLARAVDDYARFLGRAGKLVTDGRAP